MRWNKSNRRENDAQRELSDVSEKLGDKLTPTPTIRVGIRKYNESFFKVPAFGNITKIQIDLKRYIQFSIL